MSPPVAVSVVPTASDPVKLAAELIVWLLIRPDVTVFAPRFNAPLEVIAPNVELPALRAVANRFVLDAVVAKNAVDVANVVVAWRPVKFCSVVEPV